MKISEMLTLATKGYSAADIKTVAELSKDTPEILELAKTGLKVSDLNDLVALADAGDSEPDTKTPSQETGESDQTPDYKKLYEDQKKKIEDLESTVSKIQKSNAEKDVSGDQKAPDIIDTLSEMMKDCT